MTRMIDSPVTAEIVIAGVRHINFGGSSYLGLSANPQIVAAGTAALLEAGAGYQFPRHHRIATHAHRQAEAEAAAFFGTEAALYLPNGYSFGLVTLATLRDQVGAVFFDEWAHHCLREAIAASGLPGRSYRHLDPEDLQRQLKQHLRPNQKPLVVTDALYSTFGEIAPVDALASVIAPYEGKLLVDESHSFGVLGGSGRGVREHFTIDPAILLSGGSTGKALGVLGGIIPAQHAEFEQLRLAPASSGAAAGLPAAAAMLARSLRYIREHPELLSRLRANTAYVKQGLRSMGLDVIDNIAPVASFVAGSHRSMQSLQAQLLSEGIFVFHSTYIGAGDAGAIRCAIFADHTQEHMDRLLETLRRHL